MSTYRIALGRRGEQLAAAYLRGLGLKIKHLNFRVKRAEIDIIAKDGETLVFVEVRSRAQDDRFSPVDSVDATKRRRVRKAVELYLMVTGCSPHTDVRVDVVGVTFETEAVCVEHFPNAF